MTTIIAFAGRKQSGKTTCSETLLDFWNTVINKDGTKTGKIYNFADPLKQDICMDILGMSYDQCYGTDEQKNELTDIEWDGSKLTAREVMQFVGTDLFRKMKHNVWADATINKIKIEYPDLAIIADCRFPNEVDVIKNAGGHVIKLNRNPFNSDHASEVALDHNKYDHRNFDFVLMNDSMSIDEQNFTLIRLLTKKGILQL
jgi:hypothetical protein